MFYSQFKRFWMKKIKANLFVIILFFVFILANAELVSSNGEDTSEHGFTLPVWTYYVEIVEHTLMIIVGIAGILLLIKPYKTHKNEKKQGILWMILGLIIFVFSQLLTNLHHFLFFPFGIWNAIIHHGLYLVSIVIIILAFFKILAEDKSKGQI